LKRIASISLLILPLLALVSASSSMAQTIVVDKPNLTFSSQVGGSVVSQTVNVTSNTGASVPFALIVPNAYSWLKVGGQTIISGSTPAAVTITADPTGLSAGTYPANPPALITVSGGSANSNSPIAVTFTVSSIGVSPSSLAFNYTVGSPNFPASQSIALSTASTPCTVTSASASGGSWFTLLQNSCVSGSITVLPNVAVIAGLGANTYTGTITITPLPAGQSPAVVVPVTLTVTPTPPVSLNPGSLVFNWQTGTTNPSESFTIATTPGQSLSYSFNPPTVDTGNWISTITPPSGSFTGSTQITVALNPNGIALGAHAGKITLLTPGASPQSQDIPIFLNIFNTAQLNVPNADLSFFYQIGTSAPASQSVNISATSGVLNYAVVPGSYNPGASTGWLTVPGAGNTGAALPVSVNPAGLPAGTYTAVVSVTSATPGSSTQVFKVILKVSNDPILVANASALNFPFQIGQSTPAPRTVTITSSTGAPLNYTSSLATTTCGSSWLQAINTNNSMTGTTPDTLTVAVATAGLAAGTCNGTLTINATLPGTGAAVANSPVSIPVTLYVSTTAQLVVAPANIQTFTAAVGNQAPPSQSVTLSSTSSDVLSYSIAFQSPGNWLSVNTLSGTTAANNVLTLSVNPAGLAAGVYSGSVTVTATGPGGAAVADSPVIIGVTLNVTSGTLTLSATSVSFPDQTLGGTAPALQTVNVGSSGQALIYSAIANSNNSVAWLSVSPTSGNTSTNGILTISADPSKLPAGSYSGSITVTSPGASNSPQTITVNIKVNPGTLSAPTTTLVFTQAAGGAAPAAQSIAVSGSPVPLNFTVATTAISGGFNWLSATPSAGTTPANVQVSVNGGSLPVGQYTGTVVIGSAGAIGNPTTIGVILNVVTPATLTASPTSLAFAYTLGLAGPAAQNIAVSAAGGTGSVPLTAQAQFTSTGAGAWLVVTPASSTAPATFVVSISTAGLAAGTYNGSIVIASNNALASLTIPVTLTVQSIPAPVVSSVANAASYSTGAVSPGENIVIFGSGIGPATLAQATVANNVFPTVVGGTRVLFDNVPAPVLYASNGQTSVMVPYGVAGRATTSLVVEYSGVQSAPIGYNVAPAAPGIYTQNSQGTGPGAILNQNFSVNGTANPEKRGNVIAIYMTGEGQTTPQGVDGTVIPAVVSALKYPNLPVTVTIGGIPAVVAYAGSAPGLISGVMQVNVTIPLTAPTGTQPVIVTVGTANTQSGASAATVAIN
jgi:uncharacterized protein (TIGR03437 family)